MTAADRVIATNMIVRWQRKMTVRLQRGRHDRLSSIPADPAPAHRPPRLLTVVRLLRVYGRLGSLESFIPEPGVSPMQLVREARRRG